MQSLPPELKEEFLLYLSIRELLSVCSLSSELYSICSSSSFWREKFREEGLPLMRQGNNLEEWLKIYQTSLLVKGALPQLEKGLHFKLSALSSLQPLLWLGVKITPELVKVWEKRKEYRQVKKNYEKGLVSREQLLKMGKDLSGYIAYLIVEKAEWGGEEVELYYKEPYTPARIENFSLTEKEGEEFIYLLYEFS